MEKLCIAVLTTASRGDTLGKCLSSLSSIVVPNINKVTVLVVQNKKEESLDVTYAVEAMSKNDSLCFETILERKLGIPMARNCALKFAIGNGFSHLGFIDDDAEPDVYWLKRMIDVLNQTNVEVVTGPQIPIFPTNTKKFYTNAKVYKERELPNKSICSWAATNNVIFDVNFAMKHGLFFSEDMKTGGSDKEYFSRYSQAGGKIMWVKDAIVREYVELSRTNFKWAIKRTFRFGGTGYRIERCTKNSVYATIVCVTKGGAYITKGLLSILTLPFSKTKSFLDCFCDISHGIAFILSVFSGGKLKKYA